MKHRSTRNRWPLIVVSLTILAAPLGLAADPSGDSTEKKAMMKEGMMGEGMMMDCRAMMEKHQAMKAKGEEMDRKLEGLVEEMNAAKGKAKTDAVAAVVAEMVSQQKDRRGMTMAMEPTMVRHMTAHMHAGMMQGMEGMMGKMGDCPMMQAMHSAPPSDGGEAEEDHSKHHH